MGSSCELLGRKILIVVSGGIAAYKILDLIRSLRRAGAETQVVLTANATHFVTPLSVAALSGKPALSDMWRDEAHQQIDHIRLTREADLVLVAPATANLLAKMAHGLADDLASTLLLAADKPIYVAPAMNVAMWRHPATQDNMRLLRHRGVAVIGPESGAMACAETGEGRMSEPAALLAALEAHFRTGMTLLGRRALVTSGPTYEALDPVRFIGNRSSGKQGHAIAAALAAAGAETILVTGPTALPAPQGVKTFVIESAREMLAACEAQIPDIDIAVCAAAVADWRPVTQADQKMKKGAGAGPQMLELVENPDILAHIAQHAHHRPALVVGFAAETQDVEAHAQAKLLRKGCDWLVSNKVGAGLGFAADTNNVTLHKKGAAFADVWPEMTKKEIAEKMVSLMADFFYEKRRDPANSPVSVSA